MYLLEPHFDDLKDVVDICKWQPGYRDIYIYTYLIDPSTKLNHMGMVSTSKRNEDGSWASGSVASERPVLILWRFHQQKSLRKKHKTLEHKPQFMDNSWTLHGPWVRLIQKWPHRLMTRRRAGGDHDFDGATAITWAPFIKWTKTWCHKSHEISDTIFQPPLKKKTTRSSLALGLLRASG